LIILDSNQYQRHLDDLENELKGVKTSSDKSKRDSERQVEELKHQLKAKSEDYTGLSQALDQERQQYDQLKSEFGKVDKEHAEFFNIISDQKDDISALLSTTKQKEDQVQFLDSKIIELLEEIETLKSDNKYLAEKHIGKHFL
jgi:chromosome segregation ATPase